MQAETSLVEKNFGLLYSLRKRGKKFAPTRSHPNLCSAFTTSRSGPSESGVPPPTNFGSNTSRQDLEPSPSKVPGLFLVPRISRPSYGPVRYLRAMEQHRKSGEPIDHTNNKLVRLGL